MSRFRQDDRGQVTTALVIVGTVLVVALGMLATKLGQATDQKGQIQIAADSAALAAAQQIRHDAPGLILRAIKAGGGGELNCGLGRGAASDFASRGRARLVEYCYYPSTDTVRVSLDSLTNSVSGSPAQARAEAQVGVALGECVMPQPAPTNSSTSAPPPTPPPLKGDEATAHCGDLEIPIVPGDANGEITSGLTESDIRDRFTPALKS